MNGHFSAKRIAALGVLLAAASITFLIESLVPPLIAFAPYVRIGLANCFVLFVIVCFGAGDAFFFVIAKNLLTAFFAGWFTLWLNLAGSLCAYALMAGLYAALFPKAGLLSVSIAGAIVGNIARTCVAVLWMEAPSLFVQLPVVCAFSIVAGGIVGILTILSIKHLPERLTMFE